MLLKFVGIVFVMSACAMFGFSMSNDYMTRLKNLEQFKKLLLLLQGEIKHNNSGINEAVKRVAEKTDNVMREFLKYVSEVFEQEQLTMREAWDRGVSDVLKKRTLLDEKDLLTIKEVGINLGVTDRETQIHNIHTCMDVIDMTMNELNVTRGEKCRLYRTLGVMAGAFMAIVLI